MSGQKWEKLQVVKLSTDSHQALKVVPGADAAPAAPAEDEVTVKVHYVGINATDINSFMGGYGGGAVPFDCGLEALGQIVEVGGAVKKYKADQCVLLQGMGCWANYKNFKASQIVCEVPDVDPKWLTLPISVLTAAISVGEQSEAKEGDVALVTAAAGGFGQFAVQLLKKKGCTVVGTCSSDEKVEFLKSLGVDRVVDYKKENLGEVLKKEYPKGVNIVYECVGGEIYEQCLANLALFGRMIIIGSITGYKEQKAFQNGGAPVPQTVLMKSASMKGFFLPHWAHLGPKYGAELVPQIASGELACKIDSVKTFEGLEQVADAVEHLHSGKSFGKVVVKVQKA